MHGKELLIFRAQRQKYLTCRYQNVTFSPTIISISLKVDNMKFARCQDKVIRVPDQRYENMQNARPATLMSRCAPFPWHKTTSRPCIECCMVCSRCNRLVLPRPGTCKGQVSSLNTVQVWVGSRVLLFAWHAHNWRQ
jgi:hypothetical protein